MYVTIVKVVDNYDLRKIHKPREAYAKPLVEGEVVVFFNKARTRARLVDSEAAIHNYYTESDVEFDVVLLRQMVKAGLRLELRDEAPKAAKAANSGTKVQRLRKRKAA